MNLLSLVPDTTLKHIPDAQMLGYSRYIKVLVFEVERRSPGSDIYFIDFGEQIQDFFSQAVSEMFHIRNIAEIKEWHNSDSGTPILLNGVLSGRSHFNIWYRSWGLIK